MKKFNVFYSHIFFQLEIQILHIYCSKITKLKFLDKIDFKLKKITNNF